MAETQDVNTLRRRGRRRLVGAIALVLLAAIVLPMVFDPEPAPSVPPISLRIPGEDESSFAPKVTPKPSPAAPPAAPAQIDTPKPAPVEAAEKPAAPAAPASPPASTAAEQFVVPVAALADPAKVRELLGRLKSANLPHYTEPLATVKGGVTRVRVGPYGSREAAEQAQRDLQRIGLKPGSVLVKP